MSSGHEPLLEMRNLSIGFHSHGQVTPVVRDVELTLHAGETLALVGESGSGKTLTAQSILRLYPETLVAYPAGRIVYRGLPILDATPKQLQSLRGSRIGMIFQEPLSSLNPLHTIHHQLNESLLLHSNADATERDALITDSLERVGIHQAKDRLRAYPHQLSGGERQRVMIALAMINKPDLLVADEPTTALDVTIQAEVLSLIRELQQQTGMAVLFITHDLSIVRRLSDRVAIMQNGRIVEQGATAQVFAQASHDYTRTLLGAEPGNESPAADPGAAVLAELKDLKVHFPIVRGILRKTVGLVKAVDGVSLSLRKGQSLGLVGESGSGKSTLARALLCLEKSTGSVVFENVELGNMTRTSLRPVRRSIQMIFQDPFGSLSPRMSVENIIGEGLDFHGIGEKSERSAMIARVMTEVGLDPQLKARFPHQFSGGQRQRIALARALVLKPSLIVLDEPTSSLDRTIQFQVIQLLKSLQNQYGLSYLFISHDLAVVRDLCHDIAVMKNGIIVEQGPAARLFEEPEHDYTRLLLNTALG